jgi:hypothetical protein
MKILENSIQLHRSSFVLDNESTSSTDTPSIGSFSNNTLHLYFFRWFLLRFFWNHQQSTVDYPNFLLNFSRDYYIPKDTYPFQGWEIWINLCRPLVTQVCGGDSGGNSLVNFTEISACQQWDPANPLGHASMGQASTLSFSQGIIFFKFEISRKRNCSC